MKRKYIVKNYLKNEDALDLSIEHMLFIVIAVVGAGAVGYMIYKSIKAGQDAVGEDFIMRG